LARDGCLKKIEMEIIYEEQFKCALNEIVSYIAKDKLSASINFKKNLKSKIETIIDNPKMYRASLYYPHENYRDLIFKGYTTIYKIDEIEGVIKILDIFKWIER